MSRFATASLGVLCVVGWLAGGQGQPGKQVPGRFEREITIRVRLQYLLYLPQEYEEDGKEWPLLVFLHGAGEVGDNLELVKKHGPPKLIAQGKQFPFIVVSPQSPQRGWNPHAVAALVDEICTQYRVDRSRIYLTGLSMGGFGTWQTAALYPEKFAAIAPICGGGDPRWAKTLKQIPTWVFHGAKDRVVPIAFSRRMVEALKAAGADVKFTVYPNAGHDAWTETYNNPKLYEWFLSHRKTDAGG